MDRHEAMVTSVRRYPPDVVTIYFTLASGDVLEYQAGQYVTVFFDGASHPEGKAYSLSSRPSALRMSITVKCVGEYSRRLYALCVGDSFTISNAYGHFGPDKQSSLTCLAAGVGIAPIWSIIKQSLEQNAERPIRLWYSNAHVASMAFRDVITRRQQTHESLRVQYHVTQQQQVSRGERRGRIDLDHCLTATHTTEQYLVCGSVEFVRDMWRGLVTRGVPERAISSEVFFE